jgi:hypothetical protein
MGAGPAGGPMTQPYTVMVVVMALPEVIVSADVTQPDEMNFKVATIASLLVGAAGEKTTGPWTLCADATALKNAINTTDQVRVFMKGAIRSHACHASSRREHEYHMRLLCVCAWLLASSQSRNTSCGLNADGTTNQQSAIRDQQ